MTSTIHTGLAARRCQALQVLLKAGQYSPYSIHWFRKLEGPYWTQFMRSLPILKDIPEEELPEHIEAAMNVIQAQSASFFIPTHKAVIPAASLSDDPSIGIEMPANQGPSGNSTLQVLQGASETAGIVSTSYNCYSTANQNVGLISSDDSFNMPWSLCQGGVLFSPLPDSLQESQPHEDHHKYPHHDNNDRSDKRHQPHTKVVSSSKNAAVHSCPGGLDKNNDFIGCKARQKRGRRGFQSLKAFEGHYSQRSKETGRSKLDSHLDEKTGAYRCRRQCTKLFYGDGSNLIKHLYNGYAAGKECPT